MKARVKIIIALAVIVLAAAALLTVNLARTTSNEPMAVNADLNNAGYLAGSKLFLVSANASFGTHNGQACLIIDAKVRNDYTPQQPPPMDNFGSNSSGTAYFGLTAKLYDKNTEIAADDVTSPGSAPLGVPQIGLGSGSTYNVEIDMATSNHNINNYTIELVQIAGYPIP